MHLFRDGLLLLLSTYALLTGVPKPVPHPEYIPFENCPVLEDVDAECARSWVAWHNTHPSASSVPQYSFKVDYPTLKRFWNVTDGWTYCEGKSSLSKFEARDGHFRVFEPESATSGQYHLEMCAAFSYTDKPGYDPLFLAQSAGMFVDHWVQIPEKEKVLVFADDLVQKALPERCHLSQQGKAVHDVGRMFVMCDPFSLDRVEAGRSRYQWSVYERRQVDTHEDFGNCGSIGHSCPNDLDVCSGGSCHSIYDDWFHCGKRDHKCGCEEICRLGECVGTSTPCNCGNNDPNHHYGPPRSAITCAPDEVCYRYSICMKPVDEKARVEAESRNLLCIPGRAHGVGVTNTTQGPFIDGCSGNWTSHHIPGIAIEQIMVEVPGVAKTYYRAESRYRFIDSQ